MTAKEAKQKLKTLASPDVAQSSVRFFKTGPGQYGEGDIFIGIKVPTLRNVSREFRSLPLEEVESLLNSPIHEDRHLALLILVLQVAKCDDAHRKAVFDFYMKNVSDMSAEEPYYRSSVLFKNPDEWSADGRWIIFTSLDSEGARGKWRNPARRRAGRTA